MHTKRFPLPAAVVFLGAAIAGAVTPRLADGEARLGIGPIQVSGAPAPAATARPSRSQALHGSSMAQSPDGSLLYVADTDTDSVEVVDLSTFRVVSRHAVGDGPEQIVVAPDGKLYVSLRYEGTVAALAPRTLRVDSRTRAGVEPWGLALAPDGARLFVSSAQSKTLTAIDTATMRAAWSAALPDDEPRGVAVAPDGQKAYVVHLRAPRVSVVDLASGRLDAQIPLPGGSAPAARGFRGRRFFEGSNGFSDVAMPQFVASNGLSGVPNRILTAVVSTDGKRLFVPFDLKAGGGEIPVGQRTGSYGAGVSAPIVAGLASIPIDGSDDAPTLTVASNLIDPADARLDPSGRSLLVTGAGPHASIFDVSGARPTSERAVHTEYAEAIAQVGREVVAFDPVSFQVRKYDPNRFGEAIATLQVSDDPFPADLAAGRRFFHLRSAQVSESSLACQSCHPDGRQDGIVWNIDLGPRQTPILAGHLADTAPYHWLGSAATIDASIRETIARLGGGGLGDGDIASLTKFLVEGLHDVPNPHDGRALDAVERRGQTLFASAELGCAGCHVPDHGFTDGRQRVLGQGPEAGESAALRRFDTPSLRDLRAGAPYLHDGSAPDLESVLVAFNHDDRMGRSHQLSSRDMRALVSYLETL